ncbi:Fe-S oxidoreductase/nitrate reductase gamma subunit [Symbiobacterium terraclitae]|uniref:Fe-S oxidoreductase/nitrate reductase gamma subunit n=1 Tax=Symbiobacterium terraclitae TaxID=557451 RepID=A0ABS4JPT2_9FIRM|nr:heterodisulfide reductase-related iron-sulfur binding cluster [Symbiobacterium terraclitae]MBP2017530.1 Fe-S oxidoreductase/nitrate reductase gamma subunit [Symbiobacterium terraclitae]
MLLATREVYWNISNGYLLYLVLIAAFAVFAYGMWQRVRLWLIGKPEVRWDQVRARLRRVWQHVVLQRRLAQNPVAGLFHILFSWGFVILFIGTLVVMVHEDFRIRIMQGQFYLWFQSLVLDLAGILALVGVVIAWVRRAVVKPRALSRVSQPTSPLDDWVFLAHIFLILWTGFFVEGIRIVATEDPWGAWSPVGLAHGRALAAFMSLEAMLALHRILWWFHMIISFTLIAYLPFSKMMHIITGPVNIFLSDLRPAGILSTTDLESETPVLGAASLWDLSWKDLADLDACTECGRCQENCPAFLTGKPLNPKKLILDLQHHLHERGPLLALAAMRGERPTEQPFESELVGPVIDSGALWSCTTCRACMEVCPVYIEHVPKIVEMRRHQVMLQGEFPQELNLTFKNLERQGNPWGMGAHTRTQWTEGLNVPLLADKPDAEYLFWPGCAGAFDQRGQKIVRAIVQLLDQAGVSYAILGKEEKCTGDSARRAGNEMLFQQLAMENIETLKAYGVKKIIAHCPHCFHTFDKDYREMGLDVEVIHHTQLLARLIKEGRLKPSKAVAQTVTYHDSCYLGRYGGEFQAPRDILAALPGVELKEMERHGSTAMCCGAGGARMWMEEHHGTRVNVERSRQAIATGATTVATNCPFCMTMLSDGIAAEDNSEQLRVLDLAEMLLEAVTPGGEPAAEQVVAEAGEKR